MDKSDLSICNQAVQNSEVNMSFDRSCAFETKSYIYLALL